MTQEQRLRAFAEDQGWVVQVSGRPPIVTVTYVREGEMIIADFREGRATYGQYWQGERLFLTHNFSVFNTLRAWLSTP